jgi:hypothetical protein
MPKTMSLKQIEANGRNAQKSTGPRTPAGKAVSKMNAMKHGILSRQVLVRGRHLNESSRELGALHRRFWQQVNPVGPMEEMLMDEIVTAHWRRRRALTAESGEIALSVDGGQWERSRGQPPGLRWMEWEEFGDPTRNMERSALGNHILAGWLREVRQAVERDGELTEAAIQSYVNHFRGKPNYLTHRLEALSLKLQDNPESLEAAVLRERNKQQVLAYVKKELQDMYLREDDCQERENLEEDARQSAAVLPSAEVLEKILRYETALERQLFRAMNQLERLQRRRQGENVPPPVALEISTRA